MILQPFPHIELLVDTLAERYLLGSGPTTVLVLSLLFIAFVVLLHIWGSEFHAFDRTVVRQACHLFRSRAASTAAEFRKG